MTHYLPVGASIILFSALLWWNLSLWRRLEAELGNADKLAQARERIAELERVRDSATVLLGEEEDKILRYRLWLSAAFGSVAQVAKVFGTSPKNAGFLLAGDPPPPPHSSGKGLEPIHGETRPAYLFLAGEVEPGITRTLNYSHRDFPFIPEFLLAQASARGLVFERLLFDSQMIAEGGLFEHLDTLRLMPRFGVRNIVTLEVRNTSNQKISFGLRIEGRYREENQ